MSKVVFIFLNMVSKEHLVEPFKPGSQQILQQMIDMNKTHIFTLQPQK